MRDPVLRAAPAVDLRAVVLRAVVLRAVVLRVVVLRAAGLRAVVAFPAVDFRAAGLRAAGLLAVELRPLEPEELRLLAEPEPDVFVARELPDFDLVDDERRVPLLDFDAPAAPVRELVDREPVPLDRALVLRAVLERLLPEAELPVPALLERVLPERAVVEREPVDRDEPVLLRPDDFLLLPLLLRPDDPLERVDELPSSSLQLPLNTRCAASATASAISEPRRVALVIAVVAAVDAASAASRPASRIFLRAAGLRLIAAAAAASPAASISRLIAALVILSTADSDFFVEPFEAEPEEDFLLLDFAIDGLPLRWERHFRRVTVP